MRDKWPSDQRWVRGFAPVHAKVPGLPQLKQCFPCLRPTHCGGMEGGRSPTAREYKIGSTEKLGTLLKHLVLLLPQQHCLVVDALFAEGEGVL
eukprot:152699-Chlamydomonas_euryale.AAC.2